MLATCRGPTEDSLLAARIFDPRLAGKFVRHLKSHHLQPLLWPGAYVSRLQCALENALISLISMDGYTPESSRHPYPFEIRMSDQICMALLYKLTAPGQRTIHESNCSTDAHETVLSDGHVFEAGNPKFK